MSSSLPPASDNKHLDSPQLKVHSGAATDPHAPDATTGLASTALPSNIDRERLKVLAGIVADIDHTMLKQTTSVADLSVLCGEAKLARNLLGQGPKAVCVNSADVSYCVEQVAGSGIEVCAVIGFPLGKMTTASKVFETRDAISAGATEIDMVINVGDLKSGRYDMVEEEVRQIANACHERGAILKVIIETCNLIDPEKVTACKLAERAGADFVKTSTGTEKSGATLKDVELMRNAVSDKVLVKAAGGMKSPDDALAMRSVGAARFGSSGLLKTILAEVGAGKGAATGSY
jgi:deoxyribose-phosphate aldolase